MTCNETRMTSIGRLRNRLYECKSKIHVLYFFAIGFILSGASVRGAVTYYAAAFVAASGAGLQGALALIGSGLGYTLFYGFDEAAVYIASAVVIYTVSFVCQYSPLYRSRYFAVINAASVFAVSSAFGVVSTVRGDSSYYAELFTDILCCALLTYAYQIYVYSIGETLKQLNIHRFICISICISTLIAACFPAEFPANVSAGNIAFFLALMIATVSLNAVHSCLFAVILSAAVLLADSASVIYCFIGIGYVLGTLFFYAGSKLKSAVLFGVVLAFFVPGKYFSYAIIYEALVAVVLFSVFPQKWIGTVKVWFESENDDSFTETKSAPGKIKTADLLSDISDLMMCMRKETTDDTIHVIQCAVERMCYDCPRNDLCWTNHHEELLREIEFLKKKADERGKLQYEDFSVWIQEYCPSSQRMVREINYGLRLQADRRSYESKLDETYKTVCEMIRLLSEVALDDSRKTTKRDEKCYSVEKKMKSYFYNHGMDCFAEVSTFENGRICIRVSGKDIKRFLSSQQHLDNISNAVHMRLRAMESACSKDVIMLYEAEPYAVSIGIAVRKKNGERVCGDSCSHFKTEQGIFYIILSDGMGTGEHAQMQSAYAIRLLERFLIDDIHPRDALQITNMIASLNNSEQWNCATIDLLSIDLYTGKGEIYKLGAAASYHNSKTGIREISMNNLSAGNMFEEPFAAYHEAFTVHPGDVMIFTTDGVVVDSEQNLRCRIEQERQSMKNLSRQILLESQRKNDVDDDMTVIAVEMGYRT